MSDEQQEKRKNYVHIAEETIRISIEKGYLVDYLQKNREQVIEMMVNQMEEEERLAEFCRAKQKQGRERDKCGNRKTARKKERKTV